MKPWRQVAHPHADVLAGTFQQSEFAADLSQVVNGTAPAFYQHAETFFERTYLTDGMKRLLISVARRLAGKAGDPVIQLQTNFGGGKTHTLLAVYHFAKHSCPTAQLEGIPTLLDEAGITTLPQANIAVIDGNHLSPNQPSVRGALKLRTVWGQIAYQLSGVEGYEMVADSDESGTAPGKEIMIELLKKAAPCVILLDELVAFYRQFDGFGHLTAGTLESNMSFIQVLTESVKVVPNAVLLASLPESNTEVVGAFGQTVLTTLEKYFGRLESVWKPVAAEESFGIVRRRLFQFIGEPEEMDAIGREFAGYYRKNKDKLPPEIQESTYIERLKKSYPIHPEFFDRLYQDWSTLDKFQKTRGVLQYMAIIIHRLWNANDKDPMIMPGSIPLDDAEVRNKSTHYLPPGWDPIIESEIDGPDTETSRIDGQDTRFGSIRAAHRAARTIFLGSAPSSRAQGHRGVSVDRILLGCAIPGENLSVYEDVLKRLRDRLHYLFADVDRFWFDTRPNLRREMESRKGKIDVLLLSKTLKDFTTRAAGRGQIFCGIHVFTPHADIPDEIGNGPRLVLLPPDLRYGYAKGNETPAFQTAKEILEYRGEQPRVYRNRLFFLAPDLNIIQRVQEQCCIYLAWKEIVKDIEIGRINLDTFQVRQAEQEGNAAYAVLEQTLHECYRHLLIPEQKSSNRIGFEVRRIGTLSGSSMASSVERELDAGDNVVIKWSPVFLKKLLAENYFKNGQTEISALKVWRDCCTYLYMPRLLNENVFENTMVEGVNKGDYFGYADGKEGEKYLGFQYGEQLFTLGVNAQALLIENETALQYKNAQIQKTAPVAETKESDDTKPKEQGKPVVSLHEKKHYRHFYGNVALNPLNEMSCHNIYEELISLFTVQSGVKVTLTLDIDVESETPFDDNTVRAVKENSTSLGIKSAEFSEE